MREDMDINLWDDKWEDEYTNPEFEEKIKNEIKKYKEVINNNNNNTTTTNNTNNPLSSK
jgi:hypothetical protein